jgi:hypothetical protein
LPLNFVRDADQRAALGRFVVNAASVPLPQAVHHVERQGYHLHSFRRTFAGIDSPILTVLAERQPPCPNDQVWHFAAPVIDGLADARRFDLIKIFVAGRSGGNRPQDIALRKNLVPGYDGVFLPVEKPEAIELTDSYETFLATLGNHTRRDMRRLRRKAAAEGFTYELARVPLHLRHERRRLGQKAAPKRYKRPEVDAYDTFIAAQGHGFASQLRTASGTLLSYCSGLVSDGAAILCYQLNDGTLPRASLSLTHRSFLIEQLIATGVREFISPGGAVGLLERACRFRQGGELILVRQSAAALVKSLVIAAVRPYSTVGYAIREILGRRHPA